jgi:eukaryotic-like serine/threonine-protein kinase
MTLSEGGSITRWIDNLKAGGDAAAQRLWERYVARLVGLARKVLRRTSKPRRATLAEPVQPPGGGRRPEMLVHRVDEACDRFEAAWRAGHDPRIEDYLAEAEAADRPALLAFLLPLELELRRRRGEQPSRGEYLERFPVHATQVEEAFSAEHSGDQHTEPPHDPDGTLSQIPNAVSGTLMPQECRFSDEALSSSFDSAAENQLKPGQLFGEQYIVERHIGKGAMGSVWLVRHTRFGSRRALKLIAGHSPGRQERARFLREAKILDRLNHPNAVRVYDVHVDDDPPFIEMEYLQGESLDRLLVPGEAMPLDWVADLLDQLCDVLQAVNDEGIIHRDLKPSNMMLVDGRKPGKKVLKLLDFGIAKIYEGADGVRTGADFQPHTPLYASPEQLGGGTIDARSDICSVGLILYELLTGRRPCPGAIRDRWTMGLPPFSEINPDVKLPPGVERVVMKCLAKGPADRPQSARELAEMFRAAMQAPTPNRRTRPAPDGLRAARRYPGKKTALVCLPLVLAGLLAFSGAPRLIRPSETSNVPTEKELSNSAQPTAGQPTASARRGYRPDPAGAVSGRWPAVLVREKDGVRFHHRAAGIYLPDGYTPSSETDPVDGWPRSLVRDDRVEFFRVAGGDFMMGCLDEAVVPADDPARPVHRVKLPGFYMQKTEVTNGEMESYFKSNRRPPCPAWQEQFENVRTERNLETARKHPAVGIPWDVARDYALTKGGRLPTEAQWEFAARSRGQRYLLVWERSGERPVPRSQLANIHSIGRDPALTAEVGSFPWDETAQGIVDLTGNVREWCRDLWKPYERRRGDEPVVDPEFPPPDTAGGAVLGLVVRGGSFKTGPDQADTTNRGTPFPSTSGEELRDVGFRLVIECPDRVPAGGR